MIHYRCSSAIFYAFPLCSLGNVNRLRVGLPHDKGEGGLCVFTLM